MKQILVTGGAGFIGSHLCDVLVEEGNEVWCVDNFISGQKRNVEHLLKNDHFTLIEADVSQPVKKYLPKHLKVDEIYHLASPASPIGYQDNPIETYMVNSFGTHFVCEYADMVAAKMLFASTSEVYGDPEEHPQKETYNGNVSIRGPRACYDVSKRFGETIQTVWARERGLDIRTIRIFNTYGPRMDPDDQRVFPNFLSQAIQNKPLTVHGDGSQTRSYCYVSDLVGGMLLLMASKRARGEAYNVGNTDERTVLEVAKLIIELVGSKSEIVFEELREDDPTRRKPDVTKVADEVGWAPKVGLEKGLIKTIEYFRKVL